MKINDWFKIEKRKYACVKNTFLTVISIKNCNIGDDKLAKPFKIKKIKLFSSMSFSMLCQLVFVGCLCCCIVFIILTSPTFSLKKFKIKLK